MIKVCVCKGRTGRGGEGEGERSREGRAEGSRAEHRLWIPCFLGCCSCPWQTLCVCVRWGGVCLQPSLRNWNFCKRILFFHMKSEAQVHGYLCYTVSLVVKSDLPVLAAILTPQLTEGREGKRKVHIVCLRAFPRNCVCPHDLCSVTHCKETWEIQLRCQKMTWQN